MDEAKQTDRDVAAQVGVTLIAFDTVVKEGRSLEVKFDLVNRDSLYTICYTSGTTGMPKGAMLTQGNFVANAGGLTKFDGIFNFLPDDIYISYLPLAHVFERSIMIAAMASQI